MPRQGCSICEADNREDIELVGVECLRGEMSWRKGALEADVYHHNALKNHMERHFVGAAETSDDLAGEFDELIADSIRELHTQMRVAPPELKALYAVAIQNLQQLTETKGSQAHLIAAIKGIQEVSGMKAGQQMMLQYAEAMFMQVGKPKAKAIPAVIDVDAE